ncbi:MAG: adenylate/guanylate cyclase domain-containing protein [Jatrophihabitantaceae bacterium]
MRERSPRGVVAPEDDSAEPQHKALAERLAKLIDNSPAVRDVAVEVGVIDRQWLDQPSLHQPSIAPPVEVLRRVVERTVERYPSALASVGLNALQLLSWDLFWDRGLARGGKDKVSTATVAFTDLEGFTRYTSAHGDDAALTVLAEHHRLSSPIVRRWGGRNVKHLGDGLMLVFPSAQAAIRAALELLATAPAPLRLRAGLHTGEIVVTADDLIGNVVNVAARVTALAKGGQVLVTADTLAAAGELPGVRVLRARRRSLKGVADRISVARVESAARPEMLAGQSG